MTPEASRQATLEGERSAPGGHAGGGGPGGRGPRLVRDPAEVREAARALRRASGSLGFVPTMGYLHEGHLSLVDRALELTGAVAVSVFVNPTQFGPGEDFEAYPRDLERDVALAGERGAALVFAPTAAAMYPGSSTITVDPGPLADRLCGRSRPGHFAGVLTVVLKLLHLLEPDVAVFGGKDFQQSVLVRRMVRELDLPVRVEVAPIVRDADGLAMSSRNAYLTEAGHRIAISLSRGLSRVRQRFAAGERDGAALEALARGTMEEAGADVEYVEIVDPEELRRVEVVTSDAVCAVAGRVGETRLIDNATLGGPSSLDQIGS
jgi:pantoate--beta-alanine ligase